MVEHLYYSQWGKFLSLQTFFFTFTNMRKIQIPKNIYFFGGGPKLLKTNAYIRTPCEGLEISLSFVNAGEHARIGKQTEWKERLFGGESGVGGKRVKIWFRLSASLMQRKH